MCARQLVPLIGQLAVVATPTKEREIPEAVATMQPIIEAMGDKLDAFNRAARFDLGHDKRWRLWPYPHRLTGLPYPELPSTKSDEVADPPAAIASRAALTLSSDPGSK